MTKERTKLTEAAVKALTYASGGKASENRRYSELPGFYCEATPKGARVFAVDYRFPKGRAGKRNTFTIGNYGAVTLTQAYGIAREVLGKVVAGIDPMAERREAKAAAKGKAAAGTLKAAIEDYLTAHEKPKGAPSQYWRDKRSHLLRHLEGLLSKPIGDVTKSEIKRAIAATEAKSQATAQLLFGDLRRVLDFALEEDRIAIPPMAGLRGPKTVEARDRVLEAHEIKALWQACESVSWPFASIYRVLLLTGCRRDEVAGIRWSELDLEAGIWTLPGVRTKNGREHRLPLAGAALSLLDRETVAAIKAAKGYPKGSEFVFSTTGETPPSGWSKAKQALDLAMAGLLDSTYDEKAKRFTGGRFKPWRVHDLRRTAATNMEDLGIPTHIVETALNHVSGAKAGIVGIYQRAEHREAVKRAFLAWETKLLEIVGEASPASVGANVVALPRRTA